MKSEESSESSSEDEISESVLIQVWTPHMRFVEDIITDNILIVYFACNLCRF